MSESLDIMSRENVEEYREFLVSLKNEMGDLVEKTIQVASQLDGHDSNNFTLRLQELLKSMADNAIQASEGIYRDIVEGFLRELEEKNDTVGSRAQDGYIQELREAARQLEDLPPFRDCELTSGGKAFGSEEQQEFLDVHIAGLVDAWDDAAIELKTKAEALQGSVTQDEMSHTFDQIASALDRLVDRITDSVDEAGNHLVDIESRYHARKQQFTQSAEDESNSIQNEVSSMLGDALDDLKEIIF